MQNPYLGAFHGENSNYFRGYLFLKPIFMHVYTNTSIMGWIALYVDLGSHIKVSPEVNQNDVIGVLTLKIGYEHL